VLPVSPRRAKEGYGHPLLAPRAVVLDLVITLSTPPQLWFSTGMKAVDHAVEQLCNPVRSPYADALAEAGLLEARVQITRVCLRSQEPLNQPLHARSECGSPWRGPAPHLRSNAAQRARRRRGQATRHAKGAAEGVADGVTGPEAPARIARSWLPPSSTIPSSQPRTR
jgi:Iron-containing alcohol dehydrogenase